MPLIHSASPAAFKDNVREMYNSGHPLKQSLAAAYANQREARAGGGGIGAHTANIMPSFARHLPVGAGHVGIGGHAPNFGGGGLQGFDMGGGVMADPAMAPTGGVGGVSPSTQSMDPSMQGVIQRYSSLPVEKLQELSQRMRGSPYAPLIQKILQQKQTQPNANQPAVPAAPAPQLGTGLTLQPQPMPQARGGATPAHRAGGGDISPSEGDPWWTRSAASSIGRGASGFLSGSTMGRADAIKTTAPGGAYIIPADVIAGLGEGNSLAGARVMQEILQSGPYGTPQTKTRGGSGPPRAPSVEMPGPNAQMQAKGGGVQGKGGEQQVPVLLSHGEYSIHPDDVRRIGRGNLKAGHKILDEFVVHQRKKHIAKLKNLPGPVKE